MKFNEILFLTAALAALTGCANGTRSAAPAAQPQNVVPLVEIAPATAQVLPSCGTYNATVNAYVVNNIAPQSVGRIRKINVEIGDFVKKGQILAEMDHLQLEQAELQLANIKKEFLRIKALYKKGGVSTSDFESAELQYKVSKTTYENLLTNTILRSPVDGVVSARNYDVEDMYSMGQPIFVVQQISPVKLIVAISETDYANVHSGDKVALTADAFPGETFEGTVAYVFPVIDQATHTVSVAVNVPNKDFKLRPGMFVSATVQFGQKNTITVPDIAIQKQQGSGQRAVYVFEPDSTVTLRVVEIGRHISERYEIRSGLQDGEIVVTKGQAALRSGVKVRLAE